MLNNPMYIFISGVITLLIAFTFHEYAHVWTATQFGDDTPLLYGRLNAEPDRSFGPYGKPDAPFYRFWMGKTRSHLT